MHKNSLFQGRLNRFTYLLVIASVGLSSCGGAAVGTATQAPAATEPPAATQPPATEAPAATEPPAATEAPTNVAAVQCQELDPADLVVWFSGTQEAFDVLQEQIKTFQEQCPQINISLELIPSAEFETKLITSLAAGTSPDVATLSLNFMVSVQRSGYLLPIEQIDEPDDIRSDSLLSGQIDGTQYGLALRQYSCAPVYQYLAQFTLTKYPDQTLSLINFLASRDQQENAYTQLSGQGWVPIRQSVYDKNGISCTLVTPIRQSPDEISTSINIVNERAKELEGVLNGIQLNPYESVTIIENEQIQGTLAARLTPLTDEEVKHLIEGDEAVIIAGVFIDNAPEYPQGAYVLECKGGDCFFLNPDGSDPGLKPESFAPLELPIEEIVVVAIKGSITVPVYIPFVGRTTIRIG